MPYKTFKRGDKWEVYKLGADGQPTGAALGTHPDEGAAAAQVKALYAKEPKQESARPRTAYFSELTNLSESELDASSFVAKGVTLIRPGFSINTDAAGRARYYPKSTLAAAVAVFEGTRAFRNHPRRVDAKELPERDVRDLVGYYRNVRVADDGRLMGDLHVVGEAQGWLWQLVTETKNKPDLVELSINALGQTAVKEAEGKSAIVVESIVKSNSVDVVTTGAAGGTFAGALLASAGDEWTRDLLAHVAFDEWRESHPDYIARLKDEWKTTRDTDALKEAHTQNDTLTKRISELEEQHRTDTADLGKYRRAELADRLLGESTLPGRIKQAMRPELLERDDETAMQAVIERETQKYNAMPKPPVAVGGNGDRKAIEPVTETVSTSWRLPRDSETPEQWHVRINSRK